MTDNCCFFSQHREALILLKDVVRHFNSATPEDLTTNVYNLLGALIENVVYGSQHQFEFFTRLIPSAEFLVGNHPFHFVFVLSSKLNTS